MCSHRGFRGRSVETNAALPPGQHLTRDFPVLSAGPTPHVALDRWEFTITNEAGRRATWTWPQLLALPSQTPTVDIHCVTSWGLVARCPGCGEVMLRLVRSAHSVWLDLTGTLRLQIPV